MAYPLYITVQFLTNDTGKEMAIIENYVFRVGTRNKTTINYLCSNRTSYRCRARATFSKEQKYLRGELLHNHPKPRYLIFNGVLHKEKLTKTLC